MRYTTGSQSKDRTCAHAHAVAQGSLTTLHEHQEQWWQVSPSQSSSTVVLLIFCSSWVQWHTTFIARHTEYVVPHRARLHCRDETPPITTDCDVLAVLLGAASGPEQPPSPRPNSEMVHRLRAQ